MKCQAIWPQWKCDWVSQRYIVVVVVVGRLVAWLFWAWLGFSDLSGLLWPCMALYDSVWACLGIFGLLWTCIGVTGLVWICLG